MTKSVPPEGFRRTPRSRFFQFPKSCLYIVLLKQIRDAPLAGFFRVLAVAWCLG